MYTYTVKDVHIYIYYILVKSSTAHGVTAMAAANMPFAAMTVVVVAFTLHRKKLREKIICLR